MHRLEAVLTNDGLVTHFVCPFGPGSVCTCLGPRYEGWGDDGTVLGSIPVDVVAGVVLPVEYPTWEDMHPADQGAVVEYFSAWESEGREYAREEFPCQFAVDPVLTVLTATEACDRAEALGAEICSVPPGLVCGDDVLKHLGPDRCEELTRALVDHKHQQREQTRG